MIGVHVLVQDLKQLVRVQGDQRGPLIHEGAAQRGGGEVHIFLRVHAAGQLGKGQNIAYRQVGGHILRENFGQLRDFQQGSGLEALFGCRL